MARLLILLIAFFFETVDERVAAFYDQDQSAIVIEGLNHLQESEIEKNVSIYFGEIDSFTDLPKVIGTYHVQDSKILYKAKYGLSSGNSYTMVIGSLDQSNSDNGITKLVIKIPEKVTVPSAYLEEVYPSSDALPMNQLKFYLEFSSPMRPGYAHEHIRLYRMPEGKLETEAFLTMPEELWDPDRKRLTIFFDPGRIKRGVQPNLQLGLPLVEGRNYKLVVDQDWLDANGANLIKGFEKEFQVVAVDRTSPNPDNWAFNVPTAGTIEPLRIDFNESLDYGLLHSALTVTDMNGLIIKGDIRLSNQESKWHFTPLKPWGEGNHKIVINAWLEDLAGNSLKRKFDVDLNDPRDRPKDITEIKIDFETTKNNSN